MFPTGIIVKVGIISRSSYVSAIFLSQSKFFHQHYIRLPIRNIFVENKENKGPKMKRNGGLRMSKKDPAISWTFWIQEQQWNMTSICEIKEDRNRCSFLQPNFRDCWAKIKRNVHRCSSEINYSMIPVFSRLPQDHCQWKGNSCFSFHKKIKSSKIDFETWRNATTNNFYSENPAACKDQTVRNRTKITIN